MTTVFNRSRLVFAVMFPCLAYSQARNYTVDVTGQFPNVGVLLVTAVPGNPAGIPPGLISICSGTLIHERAFLTTGHCTAPGSPMPPPFIKVFVSFAANARNEATWIPVTTQVAHPSLPPCPPPTGCDPTTSGIFQAGNPAITDLGIAILERPVKRVQPARFPLVDVLEWNLADDVTMASVGYGVPVPPPSGQPVDLTKWDGLRKIRYSKIAKVLNDNWGAWEVPSSVCYGDSGAPTFLGGLLFRQRIAAVASDGGIDCIRPDIRVRVDTRAAKRWIRSTIWRELHVDVDTDGDQ